MLKLLTARQDQARAIAGTGLLLVKTCNFCKPISKTFPILLGMLPWQIYSLIYVALAIAFSNSINSVGINEGSI